MTLRNREGAGKEAGLNRIYQSSAARAHYTLQPVGSRWTAEASSLNYIICLLVYLFIHSVKKSLYPGKNEQYAELVHVLGFQSRRQSGEYLWIKFLISHSGSGN